MRFKIPAFVSYILNNLIGAGHEAYIVGGAVRDLIMGRPVNDWDFTTDAVPEVILGLFKNSFYANQFGTVSIINPDEKTNYYGKIPVYEITTFRTEFGYSDRRHPDKVIWGKSIEEDLIRRDFTINAMALRPVIKKSSKSRNFAGNQTPVLNTLELIDPHKGQEDINAKLIRAVGDPNERFGEDALRMMRAVRLAAQLGFNIEEKTFSAISKSLALIDTVSKERIRDELLKLLSYPQADEGYMILRRAGLAGKILPEMEKTFGVEQKSPGRHHIYDVGTHSLMSLRFCKTNDPLVKLAVLLHDVGKPIVAAKDEKGTITFYNHEVVGASIARNIGRRLRLSRRQIDKLAALVRWHQFTVDERQTDRAIRRFIRNIGKENLEDILALRTADRLGGGARETSWRLERFKQKLILVQQQPFSLKDLKVNGHDVMKMLKIQPGPMVGKILNQLFEEVTENLERNERSYLLKRIREIGVAILKQKGNA